MPPKPQYLWLMCRKLFRGGHLEKTISQFMCTTTSQFAIISAFFFFSCPGSAAWSAVCPLMKWVLHKPIETRAMAATTKIIYSESTQWSDTSISSPAGDRENRGGHYKDHISEKERVIFYSTLTLTIPQTKTIFSCCPTILCTTQNGSLFSPQQIAVPDCLPLRGVISRFFFNMFRSTRLCALCVWKRGREYTSGCVPSCLITGSCVMAFQSYCYLRQSFIIVPQQMSISKWHELTNYKSPRLIWHSAGSERGLLLVSAIPKPPEHISQLQNNSPFGILLPFFMKWFRSANKGSLGQLNLCLCVRNQCRGIKRCDFIDAGGTALLSYACACGR